MALRPHVVAAAILLLAACAHPDRGGAQPEPEAKAESSSADMRKKAGEIVTQPVRDVGVSKPDIPPVLAEAVKDPYSLKGLMLARLGAPDDEAA